MPHKTVSLIESLLKARGIAYKKFEHEPVRTSEEAAATRLDYTISQGAKALIVRVKKGGSASRQKSFVMLVMQGDKKFDSKKVKELLGAQDVRFATPEEVFELTDGVVPGGVPPFGTLWNLPVFCDENLLVNKEIIFNAGDRSISIALASDDYIKVVAPTVASFCLAL